LMGIAIGYPDDQDRKHDAENPTRPNYPPPHELTCPLIPSHALCLRSYN
jgi:hypothetical protein